MRVLLISTYDLGRQPFGLASATAALQAAGVEVACLDLSRQRLDESSVTASDVIAFFLPMHTATRLAQPVIERVRVLNPAARLCAYGLYAPLIAPLLRAQGIDDVIGGEFEDELVRRVFATSDASDANAPAPGSVGRVRFRVPVRTALPALTRYAMLHIGDERRTIGYTEASRGCKHRCRHCPIVPVYDGRFRIVPIPIVLADVRGQVEAGARHITFGDPDFLNGVRHAADLVRAFRDEFPTITYDVTIKIEHLVRHADLLPRLAETGCLFVTSAVESIDDRILARLDKGHTGADFERAVDLCRAAGLTLVPTFVAFTPWTTVSGYCDLLQTIDRLGLVPNVAPIQLAIRLLIPEGSRLLELDEMRALVGPYSRRSLTYPWRHADPAVEALQQRIETIVGRASGGDRLATFGQIWDVAHAAAGGPAPIWREPPLRARASIPYLDEPWYC